MYQTFVFADLAGFTAMTEAHGDETAAEIATTFCAELNRLLPPGGEDLKSLGDACMVRIPHAADAVLFGLRLVTEAAADRPFPQVRVGMHTGPAVRRDNDWFGSTVNIAARVAALPEGGEVLLTAATRDAAGPATSVTFDDLGPRALRNVRAPIGLLRALVAPGQGSTGSLTLDPVCQMRLPDGAAHVRLPGIHETFCSQACAREFSTHVPAEPAAVGVNNHARRSRRGGG